MLLHKVLILVNVLIKELIYYKAPFFMLLQHVNHLQWLKILKFAKENTKYSQN